MAIDWSTVHAAIRLALDAQITADPAALKHARLVPASAQILTDTPASDAEFTLAAELDTAGGPPLVTNGKPTIMRVVAWMAHEGINKNRLAFTADDLRAAAAKIQIPDLLPMDFNHSAVSGFGFEQKAIGVWYAAEFVNDPNADNRAGVLLTGIMWSWMNPDLADTLLAEQARHGKIDFSMACIPTSVTLARDENGPYEIAHDPTFFTLSALDVPPADEDAVGLGVEGSTDGDVEAELRARLLNEPPPTTDGVDPNLPPALAHTSAPVTAARATEVARMDELLAQLKELSTAAANLADVNLKESLEAVLNEKLAGMTATLEAQNTAAAQLVEAQTTIAALTTELEAANAEIARLTDALAAATKELTDEQKKRENVAAVERLASRKESLPPAYRAAHEARTDEERALVEARWMKMSDEEFAGLTAELSLIATASSKRSFLDRSTDEGLLPAASAPEGSARNRLKQFLS